MRQATAGPPAIRHRDRRRPARHPLRSRSARCAAPAAPTSNAAAHRFRRTTARPHDRQHDRFRRRHRRARRHALRRRNPLAQQPLLQAGHQAAGQRQRPGAGARNRCSARSSAAARSRSSSRCASTAPRPRITSTRRRSRRTSSSFRQVKGLDGIVQIDLASLVQLPGVCQEPRDETDEIDTARRHDPRADAQGHRQARSRCAQREGESLFNDLMKHVKVIATEPGGDRQARPVRRSTIITSGCSQRVNQLLSKAELQVNQVGSDQGSRRLRRARGHRRGNPAADASSRCLRAGLPHRRARRPQARFHHPGNAARGEHDREQGERCPDRPAHRRDQRRDRSVEGTGAERGVGLSIVIGSVSGHSE